MLGIVRHAGRIAMAPLLVDLEAVDHVPALELAAGRIDASLLHHFARGGDVQGLIGAIERTGDRLPESRTRRALEQQHLERCGVDHDKHRDRQLVAHRSRCRLASASVRPGSRNTAKNGLPRAAQKVALDASTSMSTPRSSPGSKPSKTST